MIAAPLQGRIALVTGAGRGNGKALGQGLADAGAAVISTDIDGAAAEKTARDIVHSGGSAWSFPLDVTDDRACSELAAKIGQEIGDIDILINNAGVLFEGDLIDDDAPALWQRTLAVNVHGPFHMVRAFAGQLKANKGAIVNICSVQSFVSRKGNLAYSVSKGALAQFTRGVAAEFASDGVRVNAIAPGVIDTPMTEPILADAGFAAAIAQRIPLGRPGQPEELVGAVVLLCSAAGSYVTGAILPIDGGYLAVT